VNCKQLKEHIIDYLLGELDTMLEMRINEHLSVCENCKKEVENMETLFEKISDKKELLPHKKAFQLVKKRIKIENRFNHFSFIRRPIKLYYAIATLFLGILLTSLSFILIDKGTIQQEEIKSSYKTKYEYPTPDSITFYTAPSRRLGGS